MAFQKARALQEAEKSVAQGKISQAIKQYQVILDNDPSDVSLLNTVGDLYIRDRNITEGLRQFRRLAEAYVREGFNVKAIAIYRKISKVDPNSIETLLKLADLYQLQGLSREAREQYLQVADFFKKRNQVDRVIEVLQKLVQLDPESLNFRNRLGAECEQAGKREDAAFAYLEAAEICLRRADQAAAEPYLKKAAELDPKDPKIKLLRARVAIDRNQPEEAENILHSAPELLKEAAGKRILLDAYIGSRKISEAGNLVLEVYQANASDLTPVSTVTTLLVENGNVDAAYNLVASVAESQISQNHTGPVMELLRRIWSKDPNYIPALELMHLICERTGDERTLSSVLEALGHAHEQAGNLERAEAAYQKLTEREPENENFLKLLNGMRQKLGREITPMDFSATQTPMVEEELSPEPRPIDAEQEVMVKEALENSDLFSRYNLTEKAIAELEKVLQSYPDQIEVHRRILELSRKGFPQRGAVAASQLARIFNERGEAELAGKYQAIASGTGSLQDLPTAAPAQSGMRTEEAVPPPAPLPKEESSAPPEFAVTPVAAEEREEEPAIQPTAEFSFDPAPWEGPAVQVPPVLPSRTQAMDEQTVELDLSDELEAITASGFEAPAEITIGPEVATPSGDDIPMPEEIPPPSEQFALPPFVEETPTAIDATTQAAYEAPNVPDLGAVPVELEDGRIEVEFYLENGFVEEARRTLAGLEEKYPGSTLVLELRHKVGANVSQAPPAEQHGAPAAAEVTAVADPVAEIGLDDAPTIVEPPLAPPPVEVMGECESVPEEVIHPAVPEPEPVVADSIPVPASEPESVPELEPALDSAGPPAATEPVLASEPFPEAPAASAIGAAGLFDDLAGDLDSTLDGLMTAASATPAAIPPPAEPQEGASQLSGLLAEMEDFDAASNRDDPETHYNLGVAFREMGLLDESIGEFQKVVRGAGKGKFPSNFLQACSLLAICFMEKRMPALAVRWYKRALETPDLDEEAMMALQYDLGVAYEQAGDCRNALERFTEVYSQNIDFRDVAEKIRELQQKV